MKVSTASTKVSISYPLVMGILNVSPDSFSGDGTDSEDLLLQKIKAMLASGVTCIDIGAQSTRPGAVEGSVETESCKVKMAIDLVKKCSSSILISVDTTRASVAELAIREGVHMINDISGGSFDKRMFEVIASSKEVYYVIGHSKGDFTTMHSSYTYEAETVVDAVVTFWKEKISQLESHGVTRERIICDPGIGFSKKKEENCLLIRQASRLVSEVDVPILFGLSRKKFIRTITGIDDNDSLDRYSLALCSTLFNQGVKAFRVHEVDHTSKVLKLLQEIYV